MLPGLFEIWVQNYGRLDLVLFSVCYARDSRCKLRCISVRIRHENTHLRMLLKSDIVKCDKLGRTGTDKKIGTDKKFDWLMQIGSYINTRMLGRTIEMLGRTINMLGWTL